MIQGRSQLARTTTVTAALALLTVPLLTVPAHAGAGRAKARGVRIGNYRISPARPVLYSTKPTRVTVRVWASGAQIFNIQPQGPTGAGGKVQATRIGTAGGNDIYEASFVLDRNTAAGIWQVRMSGWDGDVGITKKVAAIRVRRATGVTFFNARPERVLFGRRLLLKGHLQRLDPFALHTSAYVPYRGARVKIYFSRQKPYPRTWRYVTSIKVRSSGAFWKKVKVREDGTWRAAFSGDGTYAPSRGRDDYIGIRWS
jgi:hypothetical protein